VTFRLTTSVIHRFFVESALFLSSMMATSFSVSLSGTEIAAQRPGATLWIVASSRRVSGYAIHDQEILIRPTMTALRRR